MSFNFDRRTFLKGAGAVGAASLLAACGEKSNNTGNGAAASGAAAPNSTGATPLKEFISFESGNRELESWNMLYSQRAEDANVVTNLWDGLLSFDCYGKVVPAIASSWEHNEDATVWTFHLRDDVDWVDCNGEVKAHLTSKDFLVGFEWVMNAIKNEANNTSMPNDTIVGAYEYYQLTKEAGDAAADMTYEDMLAAGVGIEAPDDYTLVFTCPNACPYFDTVAAYTSFYPVAPALIEELGIDGFRGCDNTTMWYNGPYMVEEYIQGNTKSYIPNPNYYDAANVSRFERFTVTMISDGAISLQLYQNRELDEVDLGESSITTIQSDPSNEYNQQLCEKRAKKFSYCFIFNYDKMNTDGTPDENWNKAIANKAFRQCFSKGMVLNKFFARYNPINPLKCENDFFTMKGLCYTSDGTDYTNLVADYAYLAFEVDNNTLEDAVKGIRALKLVGSNVSMPNKTVVGQYLDKLSPAAELCGAVNTIVNENGVLTGHITDGIGFMQALKDNDIDVIGKKMTIAGAGGAATAIEIQAALDGVKEISIFNIHDKFWANAEETVRKINEKTDCKAALYDLDDKEKLREEMADSYIFVNGTGVGMKPLEGMSVVPDKSFFRPELIVIDVPYSPLETKMRSMAKEVGCKTMNGLGMMLFQGAAAFKLWTGKDMPIEHMKEVLNIRYDD